jgi:hypothetical protein
MSRLFDAFWRAAAYCLHPRVILLSLLPLLIAGGMSALLYWLFWDASVAAVNRLFAGWPMFVSLLGWFASVGGEWLRNWLAPLVVVALAVPGVIIVALLLVAVLMTPAIVNLVAARRFPLLERKHGATFWSSAFWSLGCTLVALVALVASIPLWFVPPLVLLVPPLIWGWLTYRVMSFDTLAEHASREERRELMRLHRWPLLAMGVLAGYLGAAPSLLWAVSAITLVLAPLIAVIAIWLYTLVFAFSALWFAHYLLSALHDLRGREAPPAAPRATTFIEPARLEPATTPLRLP